MFYPGKHEKICRWRRFDLNMCWFSEARFFLSIIMITEAENPTEPPLTVKSKTELSGPWELEESQKLVADVVKWTSQIVRQYSTISINCAHTNWFRSRNECVHNIKRLTHKKTMQMRFQIVRYDASLG